MSKTGTIRVALSIARNGESTVHELARENRATADKGGRQWCSNASGQDQRLKPDKPAFPGGQGMTVSTQATQALRQAKGCAFPRSPEADAAVSPTRPPRLPDRLRETLRPRRCSRRTEQTVAAGSSASSTSTTSVTRRKWLSRRSTPFRLGSGTCHGCGHKTQPGRFVVWE